MKIHFIRHAKTIGNLKMQYIGKTDQDIIPFSASKPYPKAELVFSSSLKRTSQTARIIYKDELIIPIPKLNECDFGDFEGKSYDELRDNKSYQEYISSNGKVSCPNGESISQFKNRCLEGFFEAVEIAKSKNAEEIAIVCHGGTIMAIFEELASVKDFYFWQIKNLDYISSSYDFKAKALYDINRKED